jgi:hypothetical protein
MKKFGFEVYRVYYCKNDNGSFSWFVLTGSAHVTGVTGLYSFDSFETLMPYCEMGILREVGSENELRDVRNAIADRIDSEPDEE